MPNDPTWYLFAVIDTSSRRVVGAVILTDANTQVVDGRMFLRVSERAYPSYLEAVRALQDESVLYAWTGKLHQKDGKVWRGERA